MLYKLCQDKIDNKAFEKIIKPAVKCEQSFIGDSSPVDLIAVNSKLMTGYNITCVGDRLCYALIGKQINNVKNILARNDFITNKYRIKNVNMFVMCFVSEILNVVYHIDFICYFSLLFSHLYQYLY